MPWSPRRIVTQVGARRCHRPWLRLMRQTALPRHLPDCVGETHGAGGGGVSAGVPGVWWRHPAHPRRRRPQNAHPGGQRRRQQPHPTMAAGTACIATASPSTGSVTGPPTTSSITRRTSPFHSAAMITCWSSTRSIMCARSRTTRAPCTPALHVDARGLGWAAFQRETLMQRLADMPWQEEPWKSRYPELSGLDADPGQMTPAGNVIERNIQWLGTWDEIEATATPFLTLRNKLLGIDPKVVGMKKGGNFWLRVRHELPRRGRQRRAVDLDDHRRGERCFGEPPPDSRSPRGSRVARQQQDRCRSAFDRAIL